MRIVVKPARTGFRGVIVAVSMLFLLAVTTDESGAAFEGIVVDSRAAGMGDCWSVSRSVALSLAPLPSPETSGTISFSYCAPYGLEELAQKNVACSVPLRGNVVTTGLVERGGSLYRERVLSLSVSGSPVTSTRVSLSAGLFSMSVQNVGESRFFGLSAGARMRPVRSLEACVGLGNLVSSSNGEALPQTFLFGLLIVPADNVTTAVEIRKSPGRPSSVHLGAELEPERGIRLRCGVQTVPVELAIGFAIELGHVCLEAASSFHPVLGRTDVLTLEVLRKGGSS